MKTISLLLLLGLFAWQTQAQELKCQVNVNGSQVQGVNQQLFNSMRKDIYEFMNNRKWTDHVFGLEERIDCSIFITVSEIYGSDRFKATIQVQSGRPVYGVNYSTTLFNYKEQTNEFVFEYIENQAIEFNEQNYTSELASVLSFYAYIIIGLDYDTFSELGGSPYFQKAMNIAQLGQNDRSKSQWQASGNLDNRYWLAENLQNSVYEPYRKCMYMYHRQGLDVMSDRTEAGRAKVAESLKLLLKVHNSKPGALLLRLFFSAKSEELLDVFSQTFPTEAAQVYNILKDIDPANASKYEKIVQQNQDGDTPDK